MIDLFGIHKQIERAKSQALRIRACRLDLIENRVRAERWEEIKESGDWNIFLYDARGDLREAYRLANDHIRRYATAQAIADIYFNGL